MNGAITKDFFPSVEERLAAILNLSLKLKKKKYDRPWKYFISLTSIRDVVQSAHANTAYKQ